MNDTPTLLVIDDDDSVRKALARTLERLDYQVVEAEDGEQALDLLNDIQANINGVIVDRIMPGIAGSDLIDRIRILQPDIPIVLTTGLPSQADAALGINALLPKPWRVSDVQRTLQLVMGAEAQAEPA